ACAVFKTHVFARRGTARSGYPGDVRGTTTAAMTIALVAGCGGPDPAATSSPSSSSGVVLPPVSSSGAVSSTTTTGSEGSSSAVPEDSSTSTSSSTGEGGTSLPLQDVGSPDAGSPPPA